MSYEPGHEQRCLLTRRQFFGRTAAGIGTAALASLLNPSLFAGTASMPGMHGVLKPLQFAPTAKRVIYLFMSGGPSHIDLFDYKPYAAKAQWHGTARRHADGPAHHRHDVRPEVLSRARRRSSSSPSMASAGAWVSELLPHIGQHRRRHRHRQIAEYRSDQPRPGHHLHHDRLAAAGPAQPGAWLSYGLGSENQNLPGFVVMISQGSGNKTDQPIFSRLWGIGLSAQRTPGRSAPQQQRPGALSLQSARHRPAVTRRR